MKTHEKPVAIITGAARGIGRGISLALAAEGYTVAAAATRTEDDPAIKEYMGELKALSPDSVYTKTDITSENERMAFIDACAAKFGRIDTLVNNAGVAPKIRADLLEMTQESFDYVLNTNLRGTFFLTQYAARKMTELQSNHFKSIITITSISAETASINRGEYCMAKSALSMMTKLFADRLAPHGISVYEIRPGIIDTDMISSVKEKYETLIQNGLLPQKRLGLPEDIGKTAAALANGALPYSTGQIINADGGFHISRL